MINWNLVPERFHYLRNVVLDTRGGDLRISYYNKSLGRHVHPAETVTEDELPDLTRVYHELCRRDDNLDILEWLDDSSGADDEPMREAKWDISGLLLLFQELARMNVPPFTQRPIIDEKPEPPLDWSTLPSDLAYVGEAVEQYANLQCESAIVAWLDQASDAELDEMQESAQRMLRDKRKIKAWSKKSDGSREEFCVYWLGVIFDHAGFETE